MHALMGVLEDSIDPPIETHPTEPTSEIRIQDDLSPTLLRWKEYLEGLFNRQRRRILQELEDKRSPQLILGLDALRLRSKGLFQEIQRTPLRTIALFREILQRGCESRGIPTLAEILSFKLTSHGAIVPFDDFSDLNSKRLYTLVAVTGIVRSITPIRPRQRKTWYTCDHCGAVGVVTQEDPVTLVRPDHCEVCQKRKNFFTLSKVMESSEDMFIDSQIFEIEELGLRSGMSNVDKLFCIAEGALVAEVVPGEEITVIGILRDLPSASSMILKAQEIYLHVLGYHRREDRFTIDRLDEPQRIEIEEIVRAPEFHRKLLESVCPNISGMSEVKEGMLMVLLGGTKSQRKFRSDIHMLLAGDPGLAKTQILRYCHSILPKSVYASGKAASGVGLTAALVNNELTGGWSIQAGAMVIANDAVCCIDEIDKMSSMDRAAIHEGMESQTISIAKAGLTATLSCRCGVLAAANPKYSRFDQNLPLDTQIDLSPTLLSRFDLIFVLMDHEETSSETQVTRKIYENIRYGYQHRSVSDGQIRADTEDSDSDRYLDHARQQFRTLVKRAREEPMFPQGFILLYLALARELVPQISESIYHLLEREYLALRRESFRLSRVGQIESRVTVRVLESMIRVAEASAKLRFATTVESVDIERAVRLVSKYFIRAGYRVEANTESVQSSELQTSAPIFKSYNDQDRLRFLLELIREATRADGGIDLQTLGERASLNQSFGPAKESKLLQLIMILRGFGGTHSGELVLLDSRNRLYLPSAIEQSSTINS